MRQIYVCWSQWGQIKWSLISLLVQVSQWVTEWQTAVHMSETIRCDSHFSCWQESFCYREDATRFSISLCRPESGQMCERKLRVMQVSNCKIIGKYLRIFVSLRLSNSQQNSLLRKQAKHFSLKHNVLNSPRTFILKACSLEDADCNGNLFNVANYENLSCCVKTLFPHL